MLHLIILLIAMGCSKESPTVDLPRDSAKLGYELGISFPPVADEEQRTFTAPLLSDLNVKIIRIGENWKYREATEGSFNWTPLDERISWAERNGLDVLLTIQSDGPDWACRAQNAKSCAFVDNQKFKNYIEQLLQRYPNRIAKIQFGNEWQTDFWYVGSAEEFVTANNIVYDAIQEFSPKTRFVLGGFSTTAIRFLAGCSGQIDKFYDDNGTLYDRATLNEDCQSNMIQSATTRINHILQNANYDEVDIHLYDDAENWKIYFNTIEGLVDKPIIVTEFGGPNVNLEPTTEDYQSERLALYIQTLDSLNIAETYYFKLVEGTANPAHIETGLIDYPSLTKKKSYFTFRTFNEEK